MDHTYILNGTLISSTPTFTDVGKLFLRICFLHLMFAI